MSACLHVYLQTTCTHLVPMEVMGGHQVPCDRSYRGLQAVTWVLGTDSVSFPRAAGLLTVEPSLQPLLLRLNECLDFCTRKWLCICYRTQSPGLRC